MKSFQSPCLSVPADEAVPKPQNERITHDVKQLAHQLTMNFKQIHNKNKKLKYFLVLLPLSLLVMVAVVLLSLSRYTPFDL